MTEQLTSQPERLSYTRRDLDLIDEEVARFITYFIPRIRNVGRANVGRLFIRVLEALVDKLGYSLDMRFRQSVLVTVSELQAAIDQVELVRYKPDGVSSATVDLTFNTLRGPAPVGGTSIPQYTIFATETAPVKQYINLEATSIPQGATVLEEIASIQGIRVVDQTIIASTTGDPNEYVRMPVSKTPHEYLEVKVDGVPYEEVVDFRESEALDRHYTLKVDANQYTIITFGDGVYGTKLTPGSVAVSTYIQSQGEEGIVPPGFITKVVGSLSTSISVTNEEASSGGSNGDTVEDIVRKAPLQQSTFERASNTADFEALAERVPGVFQAVAEEGDGTLVQLYIMPNGGGVASSTLLTAVYAAVTASEIHGANVIVSSLLSAHILIKMNVLLQSRKTNKSLARKKLFEAISAFKLDGRVNPDGSLYYRNLRIGRGLAFSDVSATIEGVDDNSLVDYVDYTVFTRYPTPVAGNPATTVVFNGEIDPLIDAGYDAWSIQYLTTTMYTVFKNGIKDSEGHLGDDHFTADGSLRFMLGTFADTITPDDVWTFSSSAYRNNMKLNKYEFMELAQDSDLEINIFFPGELEVGS